MGRFVDGRVAVRARFLRAVEQVAQGLSPRTRHGGRGRGPVSGMEVLESRLLRSGGSPTVMNLALLEDTGAPNDHITANPTLIGQVGNVAAGSYPIQYDLNGDGAPEGFVTSNDRGTFSFTPDSPLMLQGAVHVRVRAGDYNSDTGAIEYGAWNALDFTYQPDAPSFSTIPTLPSDITALAAFPASQSFEPQGIDYSGETPTAYKGDLPSGVLAYPSYASRFAPQAASNSTVSGSNTYASPATSVTTAAGTTTTTITSTSSWNTQTLYTTGSAWTFDETKASTLTTVVSFVGINGSSWSRSQTDTSTYHLHTTGSSSSSVYNVDEFKSSLYTFASSAGTSSSDPWGGSAYSSSSYSGHGQQSLHLLGSGTSTSTASGIVRTDGFTYNASGLDHSLNEGGNGTSNLAWGKSDQRSYSSVNDRSWINAITSASTNSSAGVASTRTFSIHRSSDQSSESTREFQDYSGDMFATDYWTNSTEDRSNGYTSSADLSGEYHQFLGGGSSIVNDISASDQTDERDHLEEHRDAYTFEGDDPSRVVNGEVHTTSNLWNALGDPVQITAHSEYTGLNLSDFSSTVEHFANYFSEFAVTSDASYSGVDTSVPGTQRSFSFQYSSTEGGATGAGQDSSVWRQLESGHIVLSEYVYRTQYVQGQTSWSNEEFSSVDSMTTNASSGVTTSISLQGSSHSEDAGEGQYFGGGSTTTTIDSSGTHSFTDYGFSATSNGTRTLSHTYHNTVTATGDSDPLKYHAHLDAADTDVSSTTSYTSSTNGSSAYAEDGTYSSTEDTFRTEYGTELCTNRLYGLDRLIQYSPVTNSPSGTHLILSDAFASSLSTDTRTGATTSASDTLQNNNNGVLSWTENSTGSASGTSHASLTTDSTSTYNTLGPAPTTNVFSSTYSTTNYVKLSNGTYLNSFSSESAASPSGSHASSTSTNTDSGTYTINTKSITTFTSDNHVTDTDTAPHYTSKWNETSTYNGAGFYNSLATAYEYQNSQGQFHTFSTATDTNADTGSTTNTSTSTATAFGTSISHTGGLTTRVTVNSTDTYTEASRGLSTYLSTTYARSESLNGQTSLLSVNQYTNTETGTTTYSQSTNATNTRTNTQTGLVEQSSSVVKNEANGTSTYSRSTKSDTSTYNGQLLANLVWLENTLGTSTFTSDLTTDSESTDTRTHAVDSTVPGPELPSDAMDTEFLSYRFSKSHTHKVADDITTYSGHSDYDEHHQPNVSTTSSSSNTYVSDTTGHLTTDHLDGTNTANQELSYISNYAYQLTPDHVDDGKEPVFYMFTTDSSSAITHDGSGTYTAHTFSDSKFINGVKIRSVDISAKTDDGTFTLNEASSAGGAEFAKDDFFNHYPGAEGILPACLDRHAHSESSTNAHSSGVYHDESGSGSTLTDSYTFSRSTNTGTFSTVSTNTSGGSSKRVTSSYLDAHEEITSRTTSTYAATNGTYFTRVEDAETVNPSNVHTASHYEKNDSSADYTESLDKYGEVVNYSTSPWIAAAPGVQAQVSKYEKSSSTSTDKSHTNNGHYVSVLWKQTFTQGTTNTSTGATYDTKSGIYDWNTTVTNDSTIRIPAEVTLSFSGTFSGTLTVTSTGDTGARNDNWITHTNIHSNGDGQFSSLSTTGYNGAASHYDIHSTDTSTGSYTHGIMADHLAFANNMSTATTDTARTHETTIDTGKKSSSTITQDHRNDDASWTSVTSSSDTDIGTSSWSSDSMSVSIKRLGSSGSVLGQPINKMNVRTESDNENGKKLFSDTLILTTNAGSGRATVIISKSTGSAHETSDWNYSLDTSAVTGTTHVNLAPIVRVDHSNVHSSTLTDVGTSDTSNTYDWTVTLTQSGSVYTTNTSGSGPSSLRVHGTYEEATSDAEFIDETTLSTNPSVNLTETRHTIFTSRDSSVTGNEYTTVGELSAQGTSSQTGTVTITNSQYTGTTSSAILSVESHRRSFDSHSVSDFRLRQYENVWHESLSHVDTRSVGTVTGTNAPTVVTTPLGSYSTTKDTRHHEYYTSERWEDSFSDGTTGIAYSSGGWTGDVVQKTTVLSFNEASISLHSTEAYDAEIGNQTLGPNGGIIAESGTEAHSTNEKINVRHLDSSVSLSDQSRNHNRHFRHDTRAPEEDADFWEDSSPGSQDHYESDPYFDYLWVDMDVAEAHPNLQPYLDGVTWYVISNSTPPEPEINLWLYINTGGMFRNLDELSTTLVAVWDKTQRFRESAVDFLAGAVNGIQHTLNIAEHWGWTIPDVPIVYGHEDAYRYGTYAGIGAGVLLPFAAGAVIAGAGLGMAGTIALGALTVYNWAATASGMAAAVDNIYHGNATIWDGLALLPAIGMTISGARSLATFGRGVFSSAPVLNRAAKAAAVVELEVGKYGDLARRSRLDGLTPDHVPSIAAIIKNRQQKLGRMLSEAEKAKIRDESFAIVVKSSTHRAFSRTYGGRNTAEQILRDSKDLRSAFLRDSAIMRRQLLQEGFSSQQIKDAFVKLYELNRRAGVF